jgi:hypothetical protein
MKIGWGPGHIGSSFEANNAYFGLAGSPRSDGFVLSIEDFGDIDRAIVDVGFTVEQPR